MNKQEGIFKSQKARAILVSIADVEARHFILAVVEETWVIKIKDPDTYYNKVIVRKLLNHLANNCNGLDNIDAVDICLVITTWWDETTSVPKYILWVERRQKKAA